eukprot:916637_1
MDRHHPMMLVNDNLLTGNNILWRQIGYKGAAFRSRMHTMGLWEQHLRNSLSLMGCTQCNVSNRMVNNWIRFLQIQEAKRSTEDNDLIDAKKTKQRPHHPIAVLSATTK